jgi:uncharacterized protein with NRDE domain
MCTLIALHRCVPGAPLVVAANRDEYRERPAEGPALRDGAAGPVAAPRDLRAGGTWLGVNRHGVFAGLTNRPTVCADATRRSRGLLVMDALAPAKASDAAAWLRELPSGAYNPFNLFVADAQDAFVAVYEETARVRAIEPGVHVVGNADPDDRAVPKIDRLHTKAARAAAAGPEAVLDELAAVCRAHDGADGPLSDTCIHLGDEASEYGTRSSTLLWLGEPGARSEWRYADGPPCETAYEDRSDVLHELGLGPVVTGR